MPKIGGIARKKHHLQLEKELPVNKETYSKKDVFVSIIKPKIRQMVDFRYAYPNDNQFKINQDSD